MSEIERDCRKLLGLQPFNDFTNLCYGDGIFYESICRKYGKKSVEDEIARLEKEGGKK